MVDLNIAPGSGGRSPVSFEERPSGHSASGDGILGPPPPIITMGMQPEPHTHSFDSGFGIPPHSHTPRLGSMPKMDFPKLNDENPRLWKEQCENYFDIYGVSEMMKPKFAALNFSGQAATWLQTVQLRSRIQSWQAMQEAVCSHFDKDRYPLQMKQLESLKQTRSVQEYHDKFEQLAHSILLYNPGYDDVYFVTKFLGGLKEEIRVPLTLHRPKNLVEASTLALLQESELELAKPRRSEKDFSRFSTKGSTQGDRGKFVIKSEEGRKTRHLLTQLGLH